MPNQNENYYKLCSACRFYCHINEPDEYCSQCGTKLISSCPQCHNRIDNPHARYCKFCGEPLPGRQLSKEKEF
ncbi:MAG TPA: hypothetical protein VKP78_06390 [bacterium]|nr:hypothetical protein [bacterium]